MPILSIPELQTVLKPHVAALGRVIWPVLKKYEEIPISLRIDFGVITQANVLHAFMVGNAQREFSGVDGVRLVPGPNESLYVCVDGLESGIDGTAVCQLKKLDNDNRSRNYPTKRQRRLRENEQVLLGVEEATFVDAGYVFNDMGTVIRTVPLVRLFDQALIFEVPEQKEGQIFVVPPSGTPPLPGITESRFNVFRDKEKGAANDGS